MIRASVIALSLLLASCSSVLTATRDTPIEDNHGTRTFGSTIDDQLIETKVAVNVNKADTAIESDGRIVATSYNGVVLLAGQDGLITANLKTRLLTDGTIPGSRIKVVTEAGVVYLMGLVTHQEADLAVQQAQQIGGVQRIVKLFEYLD